MGMLIEGLNLIRDFWSSLLDQAELGTGDTQETAQDTDLETPIASSEVTNMTVTSVNQFCTIQARFPGTSAGGQTVKEVIFKNDATDKAGARMTIPDQTWSTTADLIIETRYFISGRVP